ncbi:hypothetical protein KP509_21G003500 [Ceratopteris richardii]|uniref:Reticulon-like protein n=1 Tax=Ceratopteris richardii TaxID=49495 RepID=A0A8T2S9S6_CERRI|nr:hypothetical protein KP509_21G003500 [Ceratopteris richardii]
MSLNSSFSVEYEKDDKIEKHQGFPDSSYSKVAEDYTPSVKARLFNRQRSVHQILGSGKAADAFLWRNKLISGFILGGATAVYFVLEHSGYTLLCILSNVLLMSLGAIFVWSNVASFLNRPPPSLPNLYISEEKANSLAHALRLQINQFLEDARHIALGKDFKLFLKVIAVLWGLSKVGGWFHFLTLLYIGIVLCHTIPVLYESYEDQFELYAKQGYEQAQNHYKKVNETVVSKMLNAFPKLRKSD